MTKVTTLRHTKGKVPSNIFTKLGKIKIKKHETTLPTLCFFTSVAVSNISITCRQLLFFRIFLNHPPLHHSCCSNSWIDPEGLWDFKENPSMSEAKSTKSIESCLEICLLVPGFEDWKNFCVYIIEILPCNATCVSVYIISHQEWNSFSSSNWSTTLKVTTSSLSFPCVLQYSTALWLLP